MPKMYKRIGIVGGISPQSTALFYKLLVEKHFKKFQDYYYPEIIIHSVNFGKVKDYQKINDKSEYIQEFVNAINSLERAGVDFAVIASNTPHRVFSDIEQKVSIPMKSIIDSVAEYAVNNSMKNLLLLGTDYTMKEDFYITGLKKRNLKTIVPSDSEQKFVNDIIFNELVKGEINDSSKSWLIQIISNYSVDAVILGCTELPLIIKAKDVSIPVIDTTDVFAEATLNFAMK